MHLPDRYDLYWGDLHKHLTGPGAPVERIGDALSDARERLDFCVAYCYPFAWRRIGDPPGRKVEEVPESDVPDWWDAVREHAAAFTDPGEFVVFPAYEWHGDRHRWGDHHVIYRGEGGPIDGTTDLPDLYDALADEAAFVVPHHTGYRVGNRGKDWDCHDPEQSPVMEIYSSHGSSEGVGTPVPMLDNESMGPRTSGGTFRDGLSRGRRVGIVASNDGPGSPGSWNRGLAGVWATDLTREALWEAVGARRTYGATGDPIELWWSIDGRPMGGVVDPAGDLRATVSVSCPRPLDRIELLDADGVVETYAHRDRAAGAGGGDDDRYRLLVEFGWGPTSRYGPLERTAVEWCGRLRVENGDLLRARPRFTGAGQSLGPVEGDGCRFDLVTSREELSDPELPEQESLHVRQGVFATVRAPDLDDARLVVDLEDRDSPSAALADVADRAELFAFEDESLAQVEAEFGVRPEGTDEAFVGYSTAPKVKVHPLAPRSACVAEATFDLEGSPGDAYYVRASQVNRQYAWGSPIWVAE
jgi:hypothetical protein